MPPRAYAVRALPVRAARPACGGACPAGERELRVGGNSIERPELITSRGASSPHTQPHRPVTSMYHHVKQLMYTVRVDEPDPRFGNMLLEQFGGANGELAAALQYSVQGL